MSKARTDELSKLNLTEAEPYEQWDKDEIHDSHRISDGMAARCVASNIVLKTQTYKKLAPTFFVSTSGAIRTGNASGNGRPFVYNNTFVTIEGRILKGASRLPLEPGQDIIILSLHVKEFQRWFKRLYNGDYKEFKWEMLERNPAILKSLTTPSLRGSIGSDNPAHPAPYFGLPPHIFDPASNVKGFVPDHLVPGNNEAAQVAAQSAVGGNEGPIRADGGSDDNMAVPDTPANDVINGISKAKLHGDYNIALEIACTAVRAVAKVNPEAAKNIMHEIGDKSITRIADVCASITDAQNEI